MTVRSTALRRSNPDIPPEVIEKLQGKLAQRKVIKRFGYLKRTPANRRVIFNTTHPDGREYTYHATKGWRVVAP